VLILRKNFRLHGGSRDGIKFPAGVQGQSPLGDLGMKSP